MGSYLVLTLFEKIREFFKKTQPLCAQPEFKFPEIEYKTFQSDREKEDYYITKLLQLRMSPIKDRLDAMKKQYLLEQYKSILKELREEKGSG